MDLQNRKLKVAQLSVLSNTALVVMKLAVGLTIGSVSIMSEAIHSGVDLLASIIAAFSVSTSSIPPDFRCHRGAAHFSRSDLDHIRGD